jgi:hypothetical protein
LALNGRLALGRQCRGVAVAHRVLLRVDAAAG